MESPASGMAARSAAAREWRRGWPLVAAAMIGIGAGPGLFQNLSSLFVPGMMADFGWSRGDIATASGIGLLGAMTVPLLGRIADRVGIRPVIVAAMLLLAIAYLGLARLSGPLWQYQALVFVVTLSVGGASSVVYGKLISAAFTASRGLALGVATSGLSVTTLVMPALIGTVMAAQGWRGGFIALAVTAAVVALPIVLIAIRHAPPVPTVAETAAHGPPDGLSARQARRDARFWRLGIAGLLINVATTGFVTQLVPFGLDHGLSAAQAALLLSSFGASQLVGRLLIGALVDRFRPEWIAAAVALLSCAGFAGLQIDAPGFTALMLLVFVAGLMNGADQDLMPFFTARLFGLRGYGEIYGSLMVLALIGTAAGIVGFGRLHDATGGYSLALGISCAAMLATAVIYASLDGGTADRGALPAVDPLAAQR